MKKNIINILLVAILISSILLQSSVFADDVKELTAEEKEKFITLARNAYCMYHMIDTEYYRYCEHPGSNSIPEEIEQFILENGYYSGVTESTWFDVKEAPIGIKEAYPYADKMSSFEAWEKDICKYFAKGVLMIDHVIEWDDGISKWGIYLKDDKTYGYQIPMIVFPVSIMDWDNAELKFTGENTAVLTIGYKDEVRDPYIGEDTITFLKTSDGWRVDGGSHFEYYKIKLAPPQTSDNSAVYIALASVSLVALAGVTLVSAKKKYTA